MDACASNCGKTFHLEIASRDFEGDLRKLIHHPEQKIVQKVKALMKKWAEGDFKTDPQLNLIPSLYNKLKSEGHDFSSVSDSVSLPTFCHALLHIYHVDYADTKRFTLLIARPSISQICQIRLSVIDTACPPLELASYLFAVTL